jgi:3-amino-4-hydroxybenzoic acid synthase
MTIVEAKMKPVTVEKKEIKKPFVTDENVSNRQAVKLSNINTSTSKRENLNRPEVWFDSALLAVQTPADDIFARIINFNYTGLIVHMDSVEKLLPAIPKQMKVILKIESKDNIAELTNNTALKQFKGDKSNRFIVGFNDVETLIKLKSEGFNTCYNCYVDDNDSLHSAINDGLNFDYLAIHFKDPTNIPLELVIASLQKTGTILLKQIDTPVNVDDAIVTLGVMEYGAEGVIFSPQSHDVLDEFMSRLDNAQQANINIQVGTIKSTSTIGMGYRACIDTATLFDDDEGMLVGSTSQGGILCCPEVYFLPYMELRPFRINAGGVHSYVYNTDDRTDYMSELKAGSPIMIVNSKGRVRTAPVGRMKIEKRPLRLIEVEFANGKEVNVIMQNDWHVRIFSDKSLPLNISELKPGDKVMGYITETGRHVGIKIDENILEK